VTQSFLVVPPAARFDKHWLSGVSLPKFKSGGHGPLVGALGFP
jgi:hypothetical protein